MAYRKTARELLKEQQTINLGAVELNSWEEFYALLVSGKKDPKRINPTQLKLWLSQEPKRAYKGPAGCAKTSTIAVDAVAHAVLEPGSSILVARHDYNDLLDTTMKRVEEVVARLPAGTLLDRNKSPPAKWWLRPVPERLPDGTLNEEPSQLTFMGMKDGLKGSYEFNGAVLDEADEMDEKAVLGLFARLRHMKGTCFLDLAFNPPGEEHWLYTACTGFDAHGEKVAEPVFTLFEPQPRENVINLRPGYYEELTEKLPEDLRQRLVDGVWGSTFPGDPVVRQFSRLFHVREDISWARRTLFRFWDFGYNRPFCGFAQVTADGRLEILHELLGHRKHIEQFAAEVKSITSLKFPDSTDILDYGDPAVKQEKDTGSAMKRLRDAGIQVRFMRTPFDESMNVLRKRFETVIAGKPAVSVHRSCKYLIAALSGGYCFKDDGFTPRKDGYYDHGVDALRYIVWNVWGASGTVSTTNLQQSIAYWSAEEAFNERLVQRATLGADGRWHRGDE